MAKIIKNGVVYVDQTENSTKYVRGNSDGTTVTGTFKIYSGTDNPSTSLGQNGDIYLKKVSN